MPAPWLLVPLGLLALGLLVQALFFSLDGSSSVSAFFCGGYTIIVYDLVAYGLTRRPGWAAILAVALVSGGWAASRLVDLGYAGALVPAGPGMLLAYPANVLHGRLLAWRVGDPVGRSAEVLERSPGVQSRVNAAAGLPDGRILLVVSQSIRGADEEWHKLVRLLPSGEVDGTFPAALQVLPAGSLSVLIEDVAADGSFLLGPSRGGDRDAGGFLGATPQGELTSLADALPPRQEHREGELGRVRRHPRTGQLTALVVASRAGALDPDDPETRVELWRADRPATDLRPVLRSLHVTLGHRPDFLYLPDGRLVLPARTKAEGRSHGVAILDLAGQTATWTATASVDLDPVGAFADGALLLADQLDTSSAEGLLIRSPDGTSQRLPMEQLRAAMPGFTPQHAAVLADGRILLAGTSEGRLGVRFIER